MTKDELKEQYQKELFAASHHKLNFGAISNPNLLQIELLRLSIQGDKGLIAVPLDTALVLLTVYIASIELVKNHDLIPERVAKETIEEMRHHEDTGVFTIFADMKKAKEKADVEANNAIDRIKSKR